MRVPTHFVISDAFCNKTDAFCNKQPDAFRLHFVIEQLPDSNNNNNLSHVENKVS